MDHSLREKTKAGNIPLRGMNMPSNQKAEGWKYQFHVDKNIPDVCLYYINNFEY
jgi:hypothetical protein